MLKSWSQTLTHMFARLKPTVVPDLRVAVKVGSYSVSDEIRAHLEATGMGYFTANRTQKTLFRKRL